MAEGSLIIAIVIPETLLNGDSIHVRASGASAVASSPDQEETLGSAGNSWGISVNRLGSYDQRIQRVGCDA